MRLSLLLASGLVLAGCSNPEKTARFLLDPPPVSAKQKNRLGRVEVAEVVLPTYASSQEISYQGEDGALHSSPDMLWADDPSAAVTRTLAAQISRISGATAVAEPWPLAEQPDRKLEVRIDQMLAGMDGVFRLNGQYFVSPVTGEEGDVSRRFEIALPLPGAGPGATAAAQSRALQMLAERIARLG